MDDDPLVGVVGPDASGKSTLVTALLARGYEARHIAQEHSYVPDMWQRITAPDLLIYLDVSYEAIRQRRPIAWSRDWLEEENGRLGHARAHADLHIDTDRFTPEEILAQVLAFLQRDASAR